MEVDMQSSSPTFRPMGFAMKRPRSPGSPSQERQTKRLSFAPLGEGHCVRRAADGVMDGRVANQDDWVRQARQLSIASPSSVTFGVPSGMEDGANVAQSRVDERMAVDYEEALTLRVHVHPGTPRQWTTTTRSHLPLIHITTTPTRAPTPPNGLPAPFGGLTAPPSSATDSASSTSSIPAAEVSVGVSAHHPCPPDIFLFPATPADTPSHLHHFASEFGQQGGESEAGTRARMPGQTVAHPPLAQTQDRIEGSPRSSRATDVPTSSGRKHRVTMGPRADCVKCRTGVRGHWMHFD